MVNTKTIRAELAQLPTVEYPEDVVERWNQEAEVLRMQIATGEAQPLCVKKLAEELGINLND
jgi:hypothetical protein